MVGGCVYPLSLSHADIFHLPSKLFGPFSSCSQIQNPKSRILMQSKIFTLLLCIEAYLKLRLVLSWILKKVCVLLSSYSNSTLASLRLFILFYSNFDIKKENWCFIRDQGFLLISINYQFQRILYHKSRLFFAAQFL